MSEENLKERTGYQIEDDGELSSLNDVIADIRDFVEQFSLHSMNSDGAAELRGKREAYLDVIDYLDRINPAETLDADKKT